MPKEKESSSKPGPKAASTENKTGRGKTKEPVIKLEAKSPTEGPVINSAKTARLPTSTRKTPTDKLTVPPPKNGTGKTGNSTSSNSASKSKSATPPRASKQPSEPVIRRAGRDPGPSEIPPARSSRQPQGGFHNTDSMPGLSQAARQEIYGILLLVTALILFFGLLASNGVVAQVGMFFRRIFGIGAFLIPVLIGIIGVTHFWEGFTKQERFNQLKITAGVIMILAFMCLLHLFASNPKQMAEDGQGGGYVAYYITAFLAGAVTPVGAFFLLVALMIVGAIIAFDISLRDLGRKARSGYRQVRFGEKAVNAAEPDEFEDFDEDEDLDLQGYVPKPVPIPGGGSDLNDDELLHELLLGGSPKKPSEPILNVPPSKPVAKTAPPPAPVPAPAAMRPLQQAPKPEPEIISAPQFNPMSHKEWSLPKINILASFSDVEVNPTELRKRAKLIEDTLASFGVSAFVREVNTGPTVTQFALEPDIGVKVSKIVALQNDLALALAAPSIRLEAPVPGQSRVGIEVPNAKIATVGLRELMESDEFARKVGKLKIALGRDVAGQPIVPDLARMPHLLIAGSTGSGKSVCVNTIIASLIFHHRPDQLQFIMIDPKMVELSTYNGIPHLRFPVVTQIEADPEEERKRSNDRTPTVMSVLKWSIREMEKRYKHLSLTGHRNIDSYNKIAGVGNNWEKLPYLVIIIDELADLMMVAPEEAESSICRLAQKARAVGIHLILATQRPSVDVVTGLIKANFPSRITFAVTSQIDSRVILDTVGAEKLLGRGDMLYLPSDAAKPYRVQGTYVSDEEIDSLVKFWRGQNDFLTTGKDGFAQTQMWPQELREIESERGKDDDGPDELFEAALEAVREARSASTSLLQRRLRIGYNRAARLIEELEQAGVIGRGDGGKPRAVLLEEEDLNRANPSLTAAAGVDLELSPAQRREQERRNAPAPLNSVPGSSAGFDDDDPPL
jgi:S-DNA-T family DNA segregation ATPase FtsK/SpoIIIE